MQKRRASQPWHQRGIFHGIPEPETTPSKFVVSPVRAHRDARGEEHPRGKRPRSHPPRPSCIDTPFDQRSNRKRKRDRKANIAEVEQWRMNGEADVLQDRIQVTPSKGACARREKGLEVKRMNK